MFDVVIVGAGPAGMNAGLVLGRVRRQVLLADAGAPRNSSSRSMHGMLSRDGADPAEVRRVARAELGGYPSVQVRDVAVVSAAPSGEGFEVTLADGTTALARRLLLATGVTDELPPVEGLARLWGRGVYHCPYCHGWEVRDQPVAVLGGDDDAAYLALNLARLGCDIVLCTDGDAEASEPARAALRAHGVRVCEELVLGVTGEPGTFVRLSLSPGWTLERRALFVHPATLQGSDLARQLGCALLDDGSVRVNELGQTSVPGVYAAGDLCRSEAWPKPLAQVVMAAGLGARAAVVIDQELLFGDVFGQHARPAEAGAEAVPGVSLPTTGK